jgi:molecular chaperone Hsp33
VNTGCSSHELPALESLIFSQAIVSNLLLTALVKNRDRIGLDVDCTGPLKGFVSEADASGTVRGYMRSVPVDTGGLSEHNPSLLYGAGALTVTRYLEGRSAPVSGTTALLHGDLAKDLTVFFLESEQLRTSIINSVTPDREGRILAAAGLFIQAMPGASDQALASLEEKIFSLPKFSAYLLRGKSTDEFVSRHFGAFGPAKMENIPVRFDCSCSAARFSSFLASVSAEEKSSILKEGPFPLELKCRFCSSKYSFTKEELEPLLG